MNVATSGNKSESTNTGGEDSKSSESSSASRDNIFFLSFFFVRKMRALDPEISAEQEFCLYELETADSSSVALVLRFILHKFIYSLKKNNQKRIHFRQNINLFQNSLIFLDYFAQIYIFKILIVSIAATVPILFN
jgi:hypothetical protein